MMISSVTARTVTQQFNQSTSVTLEQMFFAWSQGCSNCI